MTYFDSFGFEHIPKEIKKNIGSKNIKESSITTNVFRIQAYDSVMCRYFDIFALDMLILCLKAKL